MALAPGRGDLRTPALLLVSHGSSDPDATTVSEDVAASVRQLLGNVRVASSYLDHASPGVTTALIELFDGGWSDVVVVPFFLSAAYHVRVDLPAAVTQARLARPELAVRTSRHLGQHPLVIEAVLLRLADAGIARPDAVLLVAAGSTEPTAIAEVADVATRVSAAGGWRVVLAFASGTPPLPDEALRTLATEGLSHVAVAPFLLGPGRFSAAIVTASAAAPTSLRTTVSGVLGAHPALVELVALRYRETAST